MFYQGQYQESGCGCNSVCPQAYPTYQQCNQVVQTANVQDVPHYTNYHTHAVNNITYIKIKKMAQLSRFFVLIPLKRWS